MTAAATACPRCETALEDGDLRCAICALPVASAGGSAGAAGGATPAGAAGASATTAAASALRAQVLRCDECGAAISFSPEARAPRCGFCGAAMTIEQPIDPLESARRRLPFSVSRATAEAALRGWLGARGWFAPPALASEAVLDSLTPLSWAAWQVSAEARVAWAADSDAGAMRSAWAPHAGTASLTFRNIVVPASRGLREVEAQLLIPHYDLAAMQPIDRAAAGAASGADTVTADDTAATRDAMVERFDAQRSAARRHVQSRIEALARVRIQSRIPGRRHRNVRVACLLERQTTERIALPVWILAYRYRGNPYRAIVHGQRPEVVFGRSPIDWSKVGWLIAIAAALAAVIAIIALILTAR